MNPFASIDEDRPVTPKKPEAPVRKAKPKPTHDEAKAIYAAYLKKIEELKPHQEYALKVAHATDGPSKTPVKPLATMGCNGGALLCDHCGKAIILESAPYYNVPADVAWASNPSREQNWVSYIKGGLMIRIVDNGTLRIYHGYDGTPDHCCTVAKAQMDAAEAKHVRDMSKFSILLKYFEEEFPQKPDDERQKLASHVFNVMFSFDPGIGVNIPCTTL